MTAYQQIFNAVTTELAYHQAEIDRAETDTRVDLTQLSIKVFLDRASTHPIKVSFQAESTRELRKTERQIRVMGR